MTPSPGDPAADCPRCDADRVCIGAGAAVHAAYCERCELVVTITADAMTVGEVMDCEAAGDFDDYTVREGSSFGPDHM